MAQPRMWKLFFALSSLLLVLTIYRVIPDFFQLANSVNICKSPLFLKVGDPLIKETLHHANNIQDYGAMMVKLAEIESTVLFHRTKQKSLVLAKDISFGRYYAQRDLQGWSLSYTNYSFEVIEQSFRTQVKLSDLSVFICLGIQSQDKHCLKPNTFRLLSQTQKYNQIHGIREILWRKDSFCYTVREALHTYHGYKAFTFPCWVLPKDNDRLKTEMERRNIDWIVKPSGQGEGHGIFVVSSFPEIEARQQTIFGDSFVVQPLLKDPCLVNGKKFDFRTYVLVTSVSPLRAYIYKEGLVRFASSKYDSNATRGGKEQQFLTNTSIGKKYTHLANLTWTFKRLKEHLDTVDGMSSEQIFDSLNEAIVRTLLISELRFLKDFSSSMGGYDCHNCFHLLGVDVIIDSKYRPIVIEVNGLPSMQLSHELGVPPDPSNPYTATKFGLMHDMLQILYKPTQVAANLTRDLQTLDVGVKPGPLCDEVRHTFCLDYKDLQKMLDSKREYLNRGGYQRIYPSADGHKYSSLIQHMHDLILKKFGSLQPPRTLWRVHHLYTALEKLYSIQ